MKVLSSYTRAETFISSIDRLYSASERNYQLADAQGKFSFNVKGVDASTVTLHSLRASRIGSGIGSRSMKELCDYADTCGVTLRVTANPGYGSKMTRLELIAWYNKFGFEGERTMHRQPKATAAISISILRKRAYGAALKLYLKLIKEGRDTSDALHTAASSFGLDDMHFGKYLLKQGVDW